MEEKWTIEKLNRNNWTTWKFQMKHLLLAKGFWCIVDGSETLDPVASAERRAEYGLKSQKAFSTIVLAMNTAQLYLVTSCEEPKEAWDALKNHFERGTLANKLFLKKQYFRTEMKEGTSMQEHLKQMKDLMDRLPAIGVPISEEDQVVTLLGSLPKSYTTLVTALEARVDDITMDFVQQALIHQEMKQAAQPGQSRGTESALMGSKPREPPKCYKCGVVGHIRRNCPTTKGKSKGRSKSSYKPTHKAKAAEGKH